MGTAWVALLVVLILYGVIGALVVRAYLGARRRPEYTVIRRVAIAMGILVALTNVAVLGSGRAGDVEEPPDLRLAIFVAQAFALLVGSGVAFVVTLVILAVSRRVAVTAVGWVRRPAVQPMGVGGDPRPEVHAAPSASPPPAPRRPDAP